MKNLNIKIATVFFTALLVTLSLHAQPGKKTPQAKIKSLKIAAFTEVLALTPDEAKVFWPLYNEYQEKMEDLKFEEIKFKKKLQNKMVEVTEDDYKEAIEKHLELEQQKLDLTESYYKKYQSVLPYEKIYLIPVAEKAFKKELLNRIRQQPPGNKPVNR